MCTSRKDIVALARALHRGAGVGQLGRRKAWLMPQPQQAAQFADKAVMNSRGRVAGPSAGLPAGITVRKAQSPSRRAARSNQFKGLGGGVGSVSHGHLMPRPRVLGRSQQAQARPQ